MAGSLLKLICFLVLCLWLQSGVVQAGTGLYQYDILVIHSYHKDMDWVEQLQEGIEQELARDGPSIDLKVEYMDSKRYDGDAYFSILVSLWRYKYANAPPDCILVCDDNALNLVLSVRDEIFPGIPVVFCGINRYEQERFLTYTNLTGVIEEYDLAGTLDLIKELFPARRNLLIINDDTVTGKANKARLEEISYDYGRFFTFIHSGRVSVTELINTVDSLSKDSAILLMSFNRDAEGRVLRYRDAIRLVRTNSSVPVFGVWSFYLGRGLFGGSLVDGYSQGRTAAKLCLRILKGESASSIPIIRKSPNRPMFDYEELERFSISTSMLPLDSVVINIPDSLWYHHKYKIIGGVLVFIFQGVLILLLLHNSRRRLASERQLARTKNDLETTLESLGEAVISMDGNFLITRANNIAGVVLILHDITERKSMQVMLAQTRRLEAIGQLAGGVAHDFNNILTGISGYAEMLALQLSEQPKLQSSAIRIQQACRRAAELTRQLLSFARKGKVISSPIDCHATLDTVLGLLERTLDKNIALRRRYDAGSSVIVGDPAQLENVFLNLGINGADAMPGGGRLVFTTENVEFSAPFLCEFGETLDPGHYLCVGVEDTGHGIPPESLQLIFEPFYTTKEAGKGTGLGLAAVYGAMKEHGGGIRLSSEVGKGTIFKLYFPVEEGAVLTDLEQVSHGSGRETLLIIDDEQLILTSANGLLTELGYTVLLARSGERGLVVYERYRDAIDLVLLDMIMPEMDGAECSRRLKKINPEVKIVICSGFPKASRFKDIDKLGVNGFLQKPFTGADVSRVVQQICHSG